MIDLSKAYAGQNIKLSCGLKLNAVYVEKRFNHVVITDYEDYYFNFDGTTWVEGEQRYGNVVSIEDIPQVQVARHEGELKGMKYALNMTTRIHDRLVINHVISELETQLLTLQNNQ